MIVTVNTILIIFLCIALVIQTIRVIKLSRKNIEQEHTITNLMYINKEDGNSWKVYRSPGKNMTYEPGYSASTAPIIQKGWKAK